MSHHEKCATDEIFVGNTARNGDRLAFFKAKGMKTVRLGEKAYSIDGGLLSADYAPIFINRSEADLHNEIMMTQAFCPNWKRH